MKTIAIILATILASAPALAPAAPEMSSHIYGVHNWADGLNNDLKNDKGFYTVDMVTTSQWVSDANYRNGYINSVRTAAEQGFTVIMRIDYEPCVVTPLPDDWDGRYTFGERCKEIVNALKDYTRIWVIGNEMMANYCPNTIPPDWYATVIGYDENGVYDKIHSAQPEAIVTFGGLGGWPGFSHEPNSGVSYLNTFCQDVGDRIDAFAVHAYNGPANQVAGGDLDDPRTSDAGSFGAFREFNRTIYRHFQHTKPIFITEWNSYWWIAGPYAPHSEESYQAGNIQLAFEAIDQWNQASDMKVRALCWYSYAHYGVCNGNFGDFYENAIQPNRCPPAPKLNLAHDDFDWVTNNTDYRWDVYTDGRLQIQAENYENGRLWGDTLETGVPGTDYYDVDTPNQGGAYRLHDRVDIGEGASGYFVGWTEPGEWLRYVVAGGQHGTYRLEIRHASWEEGTQRVRFTIDGNLIGSFDLPSTGDWDTYTTTTTDAFDITNGVHEVKVFFDTGKVNLDWFALVPAEKSTAMVIR